MPLLILLILPVGIDILDNLVQNEKAYVPIVSTELGIVISDSSLQEPKQLSPILISVLGRLMLVKLHL